MASSSHPLLFIPTFQADNAVLTHVIRFTRSAWCRKHQQESQDGFDPWDQHHRDPLMGTGHRRMMADSGRGGADHYETTKSFRFTLSSSHQGTRGGARRHSVVARKMMLAARRWVAEAARMA